MRKREVVRRKRECKKNGCSESIYLNELCQEHYEEKVANEQRRKAALKALHTGKIDRYPPENPELRDELFRLRKWWDRACDVLNYNREDEVLSDDAQYAADWCIALAQEIVDAEIAFRNGNPPSKSLAETRAWVWERFHNLEMGLMSNGVKRPT
jgi:hypothetical protein